MARELTTKSAPWRLRDDLSGAAPACVTRPGLMWRGVC